MMKKLAIALMGMLLALSPALGSDLLGGLVGYWPFDGDSKDYSGNGNHGSTHGVSLTSDRNGNASCAYYFDGSDYISVVNSPTLQNIAEGITMAAWVKPTEYGRTIQPENEQVESSYFVTILQKGSGYSFQFGLSPGVSSSHALVYGCGGDQAISDIQMPKLNSWHFLVLCLDNGKMKYYRNGALVKSLTVGGPLTICSDNLLIGVHPGGLYEYHIGALDEVCIYNRALSSSEITALYNGGLRICSLKFDANGGEGNMEAIKILGGKKQDLPLNSFKLEGASFAGWATSKDGAVEYEDGQEIEVPGDMTLYAVWSRPMTLLAESADWSSGSITLRCEDGDASASVHKYSLEYCNESGEWTAVDGAKNILPTKGQNSAGQEVWIAKLTDPSFSSRLGGIPPVNYRVTDETGRVSEPCVTRTRYGLAVGVGAYDPKLIALYQKNRKTPPAELSQCRHDAELFHEVMTTGGGGIASGNMKLLRDGEARREDIGREWRNLSQKTKPGDVVFFAISTHGSSSGSILAYDGSYTRAAFQTDLEPFRTGNCNNVKVVAVLMNCHSETMTSAERNIGQEYGGLCTANILYLTEASAEESGWTMPYYSQFGEFLFNKGLKLRQADCQKSLGRISGTFGDRNGRVDLLECARYASALAVGMSDQSPTHPQYDSLKASLMANTIVVAYDTGETPVQVAVAPSECKVYSTSRGIWVLWDDVEGADYYIVRYALSSGGSTAHWKYVKGYSSSFESISEFLSGFIDSRLWDNGFLFKTCDVASAKDREIYVPLENDTDYRFEIVAVNGAGQSASCFSEVVRTPSAIQPPSYVVSLDANGGTVSPATLSIQGNGVVGPLPVPTSTGREFLGWFSDVAGGYEIHDDSLVTQDVTYHAHWTKNPMEDQMNPDWAMHYPSVLTISGGDIATAVSMTAANGCRTVGECYALGINPEDPSDDLRISQFEMQDGKPYLTLNHTEDGSGKSFLPDVRVLGTTALGESSQWDDVTDIANPDASGYRFFKATIELP